jgi:hypothetical protein
VAWISQPGDAQCSASLGQYSVRDNRHDRAKGVGIERMGRQELLGATKLGRGQMSCGLTTFAHLAQDVPPESSARIRVHHRGRSESGGLHLDFDFSGGLFLGLLPRDLLGAIGIGQASPVFPPLREPASQGISPRAGRRVGHRYPLDGARVLGLDHDGYRLRSRRRSFEVIGSRLVAKTNECRLPPVPEIQPILVGLRPVLALASWRLDPDAAVRTGQPSIGRLLAGLVVVTGHDPGGRDKQGAFYPGRRLIPGAAQRDDRWEAEKLLTKEQGVKFPLDDRSGFPSYDLGLAGIQAITMAAPNGDVLGVAPLPADVD